MDKQRISGWVLFSTVFSVIAIILLILAGYGYQWNWWELGTAFTWIIPGSALLATFAVSFGVIYWFARKRDMAAGGEKTVWVGIVLGLLVLGTVGYWFYQTTLYPPIHDISTDIENPPAFKNIVALRADAANDTTYGGQEKAAAQRKYYPDIQTLVLEAKYDVAYERALQAARQRPWEEIVTADKEAGLIEAYDKLPWFGFIDDIAIRVDSTGTPGQTRIDVRSVSRIGKGDIGVNAQRIRDYLVAVRSQQ